MRIEPQAQDAEVSLIDALNAIIGEAEDGFSDLYWITGANDAEEHANYCRDCCLERVSELNKTAPQSEDVEWRMGREFSPEADHALSCDACGGTIHYTLTDYGVMDELEHFLNHPTPREDLTPGEAYEMRVMVEGVLSMIADTINSEPNKAASLQADLAKLQLQLSGLVENNNSKPSRRLRI